eukprot:Em0001g515a
MQPSNILPPNGPKTLSCSRDVHASCSNFHIDNFPIVDIVMHLHLNHTLRDQHRGLRADVYTFLSYGYVLHVREGVKASESTKDQCLDLHQPQEHEAQQFRAYHELEEFVSQPEKWDQPAIRRA